MHLFQSLLKTLTKNNRRREILDEETQSTYLERYYLLWGDTTGEHNRPQWALINVFLHHICRSDKELELHDHPWWNCSLVLAGGYWEHTPEGKFWRGRGSIVWRSPQSLHRLELDPEKSGSETWTLFLVGPRVRDWGFVSESGKWTQWENYLKGKYDSSQR